MKIKNFTQYIIVLFLMLGLNSCSSDSDTNDDNQTIITVSTSDFTTNINENPANGETIGTVEGTTNQGSVVFSITEQTPSGALTIDSNTGELTVADNSLFDFEINTSVTGIVKVSNGSVFENSNITIGVNDIEEDNIFQGDVTLLTQEEVNEFGSNNFTEITGSLYIGFWTEPDNVSITDLSPLSTLTTIGYRLYIAHNNGLVNLNGLQNINSIGDYLRIIYNEMLTDISALINLQEVPADLFIAENDALPNLEGLNNIISVGTDLLIQQNYSLTDLDGLINLNTVENNLLINGNYSITNIDGLSNLESTGNDGFGTFLIADNNSLTNINGLSGLNSIMNGIKIYNCPALTNIDGLDNVLETSSINIGNCPLLLNINGLNNITSVSGSINISFNNLISNLNGLNNLINVDGQLQIIVNNSLSDLCGLEPLILGNGALGEYIVSGNEYNPTQQDIIDGNCSL